MTVRCLYVDDNDADRLMIPHRLERAWALEYGFVALKVQAVDYDEGVELQRSGPTVFPLVVWDIMFPDKKGKPSDRGLAEIEKAVEAGHAVIAISDHPDQLTTAMYLHEDRVAVVDKGKSAYSDPGLTYLAANIRRAIEAAGISLQPDEPVDVRYDPDDLRLDELVKRVGMLTIAGLLVRLIPDTVENVSLGFVKSGLSGASVIACDCGVHDTTGDSKRQVLLKVTRDKALLRSELARRVQLAAFPGALLPRHVGEGLAEFDGWYAIGYEYRSGETLDRWLTLAPTDEAIDRVLTQLFSMPGLGHVYQPSRQEERTSRASSVIRDDLVTDYRRARLLTVLEDLEPLAAEFLDDGSAVLARVRAYLRTGIIDGRDQNDFPSGTNRVRSHGDLHGRNVLVDEAGRAVIIDPASIDRLHWAADWARLTVDLFVSGFGLGVTSHVWVHQQAWRAAMVRLATNDGTMDLAQIPASVAFAVAQLRNSQVFFDEVHEGLYVEWEAQLAFCAELLRCVYRIGELPTPIRLASLAAAADGLSSVARIAPVRR